MRRWRPWPAPTTGRRIEKFAADPGIEGVSSVPPEMTELLASRQAIIRLAGYGDALGTQALQKIRWKILWLIPCVFAAVIMVVFILLFRDDTRKNGKNGKAVTAEPVPAE